MLEFKGIHGLPFGAGAPHPADEQAGGGGAVALARDQLLLPLLHLQKRPERVGMQAHAHGRISHH
jgi:hypothetical protein